MNKKLLALAAVVAMTLPATAAEVSLINDESFVANDLNVKFGPVTPVDGVLTLSITANPETSYSNQLFVVADRTLSTGQKYTFAMEVKSTSARKVEFQAHENPGSYLHYNIAGGSMEAGTDWTPYTFTGEVPADADGMKTIALNLSTAPEACTMEFRNIVWNLIEEGSTPEPPVTPGNVVAEWYTGNGNTFGGWNSENGSATFEQVEEDGKPCLKVANPSEAANPWNVQIGIDVEFKNGETYYMSFDVKGTPAEGITTGIQNSSDYSGRGDFTKFDITADWKNVVIEATVTGDGADRITINLGKYVGTMYMTNVVIYTGAPASIDAVEAVAPVTHWTVYSLLGTKVLDTDNEDAVKALTPGIYVINGKKVAVRN